MKLKDKKHKNIKTKGFSLLEVILVMFIVSMTFTGIYVVLSKNSQHEKDNRYSLIAANLAQEGIEIIRNKRDENLLAGDPMNDSLANGTCYPHWDGSTPSCNGNRGVEVELDSNDIYRNCSSGGCTGNGTIFERTCEIDGDSVEMLVSCEVEWESPSLDITKNIEIRSYLSNWQEN